MNERDKNLQILSEIIEIRDLQITQPDVAEEAAEIILRTIKHFAGGDRVVAAIFIASFEVNALRKSFFDWLTEDPSFRECRLTVLEGGEA